MQLILISLFLLSSNMIFCAELQEPHTAQPTHIIAATSTGLSLQELCIDVIVAGRIDSRILDPHLQSKIAGKERLYLENAHNREAERRRLIDRLTEHEAYEACHNAQDDPDHISHLFSTLHDQYLTVDTSDPTLKKCLACLATRGITPGHSIRCLSDSAACSVGISAGLSPLMFIPTVICCPPMTDHVLKGLLCFFASGITGSYLSKLARTTCYGYTRDCYKYLTDPGEAPRPIVMEEFFDSQEAETSISELNN